MKPTASHYMTFLKLSRERMLRFSHADQFMDWAVRSLFIHIKPKHVSIALFDPTDHTFCIRYSAGHHRFPPGLISLSQTSPLVQNFNHAHTETENQGWGFPITQAELLKKEDEISQSLIHEMKRHDMEVCAKIDACDRLEGYLFIGPKEDHQEAYKEEDLIYFQTLAYDIAIELEKDRYFQSSHIDPLTGALNRYSLEARFSDIIRRATETGQDFAVAMLDVDNFKQINDRYGHLAGDQVLKAVAEIFRAGLRQSDPIFRYGGEEFLIILHKGSRNPKREISTEEFYGIAWKVLDNLRAKIASRSIECASDMIPVTLSIGLSFFDPKRPKKVSRDLVSEADKALYAAKQSGKNKVLTFNPAWTDFKVA